MAKLRLLVVGGGSMEKEYEAEAKQLGIRDKVIFTGRVAHDEVAQYHNMIDIFVNISRNESFGVSVLEASACGKPVIVSDVGGLSEVVQEHVTGLKVRVEDIEATSKAIVTLAKDQQMRKNMGENGRNFVLRNFDLKKNITDTINIYDQLVAKK